MTPWLFILLCSFSPLWQPEGVEGWGGLSTVPSESECRPYIEKAIKELSPESPQEAVDTTNSEHTELFSQPADQEGSSGENKEDTTNKSNAGESGEDHTSNGDSIKSEEESESEGSSEVNEGDSKPSEEPLLNESSESSKTYHINDSNLEQDQEPVDEESNNSTETDENITLQTDKDISNEEESFETSNDEATEQKDSEDNEVALELIEETGNESEENIPVETKEDEIQEETTEKDISAEENLNLSEELEASEETPVGHEEITDESVEISGGEITDSLETAEELQVTESSEDTKETLHSVEESVDHIATSENISGEKEEEYEEIAEMTKEDTSGQTLDVSTEETTNVSEEEVHEEANASVEEDTSETTGEKVESSTETVEIEEDLEVVSSKTQEKALSSEADEPLTQETNEEITEATEAEEQKQAEEIPEEREPTDEDQLTLEFEIPKVRRSRDHIGEILHLTPESAETEILLAKTIDSTLKELKKLYDNAIRPLEILYKYRDLSNRHFGDPEIFSKPLILFMGPWSGGKSTILNYLLDNEFKPTSLRTGAEPSPAYFNIVMWGEREEVLDGTQLAADWTFSGLQKFGQGLLDRLRGLRLNSPLLEKVNIVEIPGILEIRKQVERLFPFNDACQWFIDRADVIFLVYDPSKLDVGPETEAILDQLKGREYQTRIILNKADQVKPEELMRVQGTLIWNISPLMSSQEPPVMYSTSLWSIPYEQGSPSRLLHAQERAFLRDIRQAIDKRVENKIASARRFAVRVRNHAKMVDCYLTTYYNHKTFFGNRKKVADDIIEHPQNYHIYEGLSTLTNISRYDLPDPEVYGDFFRLNALYDFQRLSDTCTYFRGCPINRLDVAIAYDLPELVGKYKKQAEKVLEAAEKQSSKS